jgi:hypothetical protein
MPGPAEREGIWNKTFPKQIEIDPEINWQQIASRYELTGAGIINVAQFCAIEVLAGKKHILSLKQLESAIMREYVKEGKVV